MLLRSACSLGTSFLLIILILSMKLCLWCLLEVCYYFCPQNSYLLIGFISCSLCCNRIYLSFIVTNCDMDSTEPPPTTTSSSEPVPFSSTTAPSTNAQPNPSTTRTSEKSRPYTTSTTQGPHVLAATPAPVLHPTALLQATTATFIAKSASVMSPPTASPSLGLDTQFDATIMNSNETVAAVVAAILFLATVTVVALTGVFVAVFVCCRQRRARSESRCTGVCLCGHVCTFC